MDNTAIDVIKLVLATIFGASVLPLWTRLFGIAEKSQQAKYNQIRSLQDALKDVQEKAELRLENEIKKLQTDMEKAAALISQQANLIAQQAAQIAQQAGRISHLERQLNKMGASLEE